MMDDFMRFVTQSRVEEYKLCNTNTEKIASRLISSLREHTDISIFRVGGGMPIMRVAAAFAVGRRRPGSVDYVLFGTDECMAVQCEGDTPDEGVNAVHYNIRDLNDEEIIEFADMLVTKKVTRIPEPDVIDAVKASIVNGYMRESDVNFRLD